MKIKETASTEAAEWTPTGNAQEVTTIKSVSLPIDESGTTYSLPLTMSLRGETNKRGTRRIVLAVNATMPGQLVAVWNPTWNPSQGANVTVHTVVQAPLLAVQSELALSTNSGVYALVKSMVRDVFTVLTGAALPDSGLAIDDTTGVLAKSLVGGLGLDVVSGEYGTPVSVAGSPGE